MNIIVSLSSQVLNEILEKNISFNLAIRSLLKDQKISSIERTEIIKCVGCSLRHYYVFSYLSEKTFGSLDVNNLTLVLLYFSNRLFIKSVAIEDMSQILIEAISKLERFKNRDVAQIIAEINVNTENLIPLEISKESLDYLSYRFNTPLWLVKMWTKHFGEHLTYRILRSNSRPSSSFCLVNKDMNSQEDLLAKYSDLIPSPFPDFVLSKNNSNIKKHLAFQKKEIIDISPAWNEVFAQADIDPLRGIAIYSNYPNNAFLGLMHKFDRNVKFDLIIGDAQAFFASKKTIVSFNLKNASFFEATPSQIITCISKPVHTFFLFPDSSKLALLKSTPDYFLRVSSDQLDGIIKSQELALQECAALVEDGGQLIYAIPTINKKESRRLIKRFIENNPTFSLVTDKQFFPFSEYEESLFFAILKKEESNNA